jgi:hypothetical protein
MLYLLVGLVIFGAVFFFVYKKMMGNVGAIQDKYASTMVEYNANEAAFLAKYWDNENRFKLFKTTLAGEDIVGVRTCMASKTLVKKAIDSLVTAVTHTKKVDMSMYYLVATRSNLHLLGFNGENAFQNDAYPYNLIKNARLNTDNAASGKPMRLTFEDDSR